MQDLNVQLKDHFFRVQSAGEIPVDGDLQSVVLELCHKYSIVEMIEGLIVGSTTGEGIIKVGTVAELEVKYPGFADAMEFIKITLITEALEIIAARKAAIESES